MKAANQCANDDQAGDSLLEVMLAISLISIAALSLVGLQLTATRTQQHTLRYAQAVQLADAAAEALRAGYSVSEVQTTLGARVAKLLPGGGVRIVDKSEEIRLITLHWQEAKQYMHQFAEHADDCPQLSATEITRCVSVAVVQ